jgi:Cys-tRNA(Pro) deacylase
MSRRPVPATPGTRFLRNRGIAFVAHHYHYQEHGGTRVAARALGTAEHAVIKTLVFQTSDGRPLLVLMHGDREVSGKSLARLLGLKSVSPCSPADAQRHTGYSVGGISPFGTRTVLPVNAERTLFELERLFINGGARGVLVELEPAALSRALPVHLIEAAHTR